jgi:circadian clock protein KaiB
MVGEVSAARAAPRAPEKYALRLYISGTTSRSTRAILNIKTICEKHLNGRYHLQVIDVYQQLDVLRREQLIALPTLIKALPAPPRKLIGDLSNRERVLAGLDLASR